MRGPCAPRLAANKLNLQYVEFSLNPMGDDRLKQTRSALVSRLGEAAIQVGLHRTPAQSYALLIMSEKPLSLDDMTRELGVSKATVSIHARELTGFCVIRKVRASETRRDTALGAVFGRRGLTARAR